MGRKEVCILLKQYSLVISYAGGDDFKISEAYTKGSIRRRDPGGPVGERALLPWFNVYQLNGGVREHPFRQDGAVGDDGDARVSLTELRPATERLERPPRLPGL